MKRPIVILVLLILALAGTIYWHARVSPGVPDAATAKSYYQESYWAQSIKTVGAKEAYISFKKRVAEFDPNTQHGMAHAFGGALFNTGGIHMLSICDASFNYGCLHQFSGSAMQSLGLSAVQDLNQACLSDPDVNACQHGIGHGLISYLGYTERNLKEAVALCQQYAPSTSMQSCVSGVFMEYNLRSLLGANGQPRAKEGTDLTALCKPFAGLAGKSCVLYLVQWWKGALPKDDPVKTLARMERLCENVATAYRLTCYEGAGLTVPMTAHYDPQAAVALCDGAILDSQKALICRAYAAIVFAGTGTPLKAKQMCAGLTGAAEAYCTSYATGLAGIDYDLQPPKL